MDNEYVGCTEDAELSTSIIEEDDIVDEPKNEIVDYMYKLTHTVDDEEGDAPYFCFVKDISDLYGLSDDEVKQIALDNGYRLAHIDASDEHDDSDIIVAEGCTDDIIKGAYISMFSEEPTVRWYKEKDSVEESYIPTNTGKAYKVFRVRNGKLYPPMVANKDNKDTPIGVWLDAEEGEFAGLSKTGRPQVKSIGSGTLSYRPGWHLGDIPRAKQFDRVNKETGEAEFPKDFVWAECDYAMDVDYQPESDARGYERTKVDDKGNVISYKSDKYQHSLAGVPHLPTKGSYRYRTNPNPDTVPWVITGHMKVNRLLDDYEVNDILKSNGIEPIHRQGGDKTLEELGLKNIGESFNEEDDDKSFDDFLANATVLLVDNALEFDATESSIKNDEMEAFEGDAEIDEETKKTFADLRSDDSRFVKYTIDDKKLMKIIDKISTSPIEVENYGKTKMFLNDYDLDKKDLDNTIHHIKDSDYQYNSKPIVDGYSEAIIFVKDSYINNFGPFDLLIKLDYDKLWSGETLAISIHPSDTVEYRKANSYFDNEKVIDDVSWKDIPTKYNLEYNDLGIDVDDTTMNYYSMKVTPNDKDFEKFFNKDYKFITQEDLFYFDVDKFIDFLKDEYRNEAINKLTSVIESIISEGTVKVKDNKWVNKGKEGTHGTFKTKKEADAQRKAMFANNFHEDVSDCLNSSNKLDESKQDIKNFIDKFGETTYNNFIKAKDRLKKSNISTDILWHTNNTSVDDMNKMLQSLYSSNDKDKQKLRNIKGEQREVRGKYNFLGEYDGYLVYQPLDYISSMDLGINTGWCTTGRYGHYGHPDFTPSAKDAEKHFRKYTSKGVKLYYFLNKETFYGEYAIALYHEDLIIKDYVYDKNKDEAIYLNKTNYELFNSKDYNIWYENDIVDIARSKLNLELKIDIDKEETVKLTNGLHIKDNKLIKCYSQDSKIIIPDSVNYICNDAFSGCSSLKSITIPNSVTSIGNSAFSCCDSLISITIPDSVTCIGDYAFCGCSSLTSITIPNSVTSIGNSAFGGCNSLQSITIPDSVTSIGYDAFYCCSSLQSIVIPNSVTSIECDAFSCCDSLTSITIPDSVTSIGDDAFYDCRSLKSVIIPDSVTEIGGSVFYDCESLQSITIPSKVKAIKNYAFAYCDSLKSVIMPNGITEIGESAFSTCRSLTSITISDSVKSIGESAFEDCDKLTVHTNNPYVIDYCKNNHIKYDSNINESFNESIEEHDTLNPKLWNNDNTLRDDVKETIDNIVEEFLNQLDDVNIVLIPKDVILLGSNCSYNYNKDSDLDVHIIADDSIDCEQKHLEKLYGAYRSIFNNNMDITIKDIPVELYVELGKCKAKSDGMYSLYKDEWIHKPVKNNIPDIDNAEFDNVFNEWEERYFSITEHDFNSDDADKFIADIYQLRKTSIDNDGEFGIGNLVFKEFRNLGYLDNLKELNNKKKSTELSLH